MTKRFRIVLVILAVLNVAAASSCLSFKEPVGVHYYLIKPEPLEAKARQQFPLSLGIRPFSAPIRYQDEIFYRISDVEVGYYDYHRWVEPPSEMVTGTMVEALRASGLFSRVENVENAGPLDLVMEGDLIGFDEVESDGGRSAYCEVSLRIHRAGKGTPLWSDQFAAAIEVRQAGVSAFARAMSQAVADVTRQAVESLEGADFKDPQFNADEK